MIAAALAFLTAGCAVLEGNPYQLESTTIGTPIERAFAIDKDVSPLRGVAVDAKQRFVWSPRIPVRTIAEDPSGDLKPKFSQRAIICAEPSPDALTAIANTIDTEVRRKTVDSSGATDETTESLAGSLSETAQTIGDRTQVIQLIRDALYRACEAYANGAIDDFGYAVILGQIDLFMLQLLSADVLGKARGRAEIAEATERRNQFAVRVQDLQRQVLLAKQAFDRLEAQTQAARDKEGQLASLRARKEELEKIRDRLQSDISALDGTAENAASIAHTQAELAKIDESRRDANNKQSDFEQDPTNEEAEAAYKKADREARIMESNRARTNDKLERQEQKLEADRSELASIDGRISAIEVQIQSALQSQDTAAPAAQNVTLAQQMVTALQEQLLAAQTELANSEAALARATDGAGPGPAEVHALTELIKLSFNAAEGHGPPGRVSKVACLQWFARNPQIKMKIDNDTQLPVFTEGLVVPGIAAYCRTILLDARSQPPKVEEEISEDAG